MLGMSKFRRQDRIAAEENQLTRGSQDKYRFRPVSFATLACRNNRNVSPL